MNNANDIMLKKTLATLVSPPDDQLSDFLSLFTSRRMGKEEMFQRSGDAPTELCFVNAGLLRMYYITPDGKEMNKSFVLENSFAAAYSAWLSQTVARFNIQTLEETNMLVAPLEAITAMFSRHQCWERMGRILVEQLFIRKERRESEFLLDNAETRYKLFQQRYPGLEDRIPQYHIAGYLGITSVALSRIRNR